MNLCIILKSLLTLRNRKEGKMRKGMFCLMAVCVMLLVSVATLEAATEITSLPWTITTQGSYIINQNLKANWHGIKVQANNVTIDLNGYSISGNNTSGGYGVYINGRSNVEIRNGTIRNFGSHGIHEESNSGRSHRVINVRVMNNKGYGIYLFGSNHMVKDCTVSDNVNTGIRVDTGVVSGNTVYGNGATGIYAETGVSVIGNSVYLNSQDGIFAGNGCAVVNNAAYGNGGSGMLVSFGTTLKNNGSYYNGNYGFYLGGHNLVDGNATYNNTSGSMNACATCTFGDNHAP
jgi:hypothetical protein